MIANRPPRAAESNSPSRLKCNISWENCRTRRNSRKRSNSRPILVFSWPPMRLRTLPFPAPRLSQRPDSHSRIPYRLAPRLPLRHLRLSMYVCPSVNLPEPQSGHPLPPQKFSPHRLFYIVASAIGHRSPQTLRPCRRSTSAKRKADPGRACGGIRLGISLGRGRVVISAAPRRIKFLRQRFSRILLDQHCHVELAHRTNIELVIVLEIMFEVGHPHGLDLFVGQVGFRLHDLPSRMRRILQHTGKRFFLPAFLHQLDDELHAVAVRKRE